MEHTLKVTMAKACSQKESNFQGEKAQRLGQVWQRGPDISATTFNAMRNTCGGGRRGDAGEAHKRKADTWA